jgi:hypothetical protein
MTYHIDNIFFEKKMQIQTPLEHQSTYDETSHNNKPDTLITISQERKQNLHV